MAVRIGAGTAVSAAVLLFAAANAAPARAQCKTTAVSASAENYLEKEKQARDDAISAWEDKARDLNGKGWAYWTKSKDRNVVCQRLLKSSVMCTATAKPCFYPLGQ